MEWVVVNPYRMDSDLGYAISKSWVAERVVYSAWSPDEPVPGYWYKMPRLLGCCGSRDAAVELCVDDWTAIQSGVSGQKGTPKAGVVRVSDSRDFAS